MDESGTKTLDRLMQIEQVWDKIEHLRATIEHFWDKIEHFCAAIEHFWDKIEQL